MADAWETLSPERRTVYRLADDLLLVFKPRGHREEEHAHPHGQRLRVLRGTLVVRSDGAEVTLDAQSAPFVLDPGRRHATEALEDTWLVAERLAERAS
ncbi:MAG TPA: hypothetical protein VIS07_15420 [Candidatus Binatia bacterium]